MAYCTAVEWKPAVVIRGVADGRTVVGRSRERQLQHHAEAIGQGHWRQAQCRSIGWGGVGGKVVGFEALNVGERASNNNLTMGIPYGLIRLAVGCSLVIYGRKAGG